jgi:transposase
MRDFRSCICDNIGVSLSSGRRAELEGLLRSDSYDGSVAYRAQLVLWNDDGMSVAEIAARAGTSRPTVYRWLERYDRDGADGLVNHVPTGRPPEISDKVRARVVALTRMSPPEQTGWTHWTSRNMASYLKRCEGIVVSHNFIAQLWREHDLKPSRQGTFKLSRDPQFESKVFDVVGLYLDPPEGAIVLSVDEKSGVQALDRVQPMLPLDFGKTEQRTHEYVRYGTTNLFGSLNVGTGEVTGRCFPRRRAVEFIKFMDEAIVGYDGREIHVVLDNLSTHNGTEVEKWLAKHPNVTFHFTPTGSSWLNQIEIWFGIITRQAIRRGTFGSVRQLIDTINKYITNWNQDARPFTWTSTPGDIIAKVQLIHSEVKKMLANND